jgi:glycosyltransferase involved in cell wall biosynthesis
MVELKTSGPLVSVIIPCYNQAHYVPEAIKSVLAQSYQNIEIVVVDDGSTDNTREIAERMEVKYIYQKNGGLSAARNTGIDKSTGEFLVFLDSDDWLLADAIAINVMYLNKRPEAVFVAGSHQKIGANGVIAETRKELTLTPYQQLLHQNYIGMIAAVMFRRSILQQYRYDTTLHSCEDYDLYLKITRDHEVINHLQEIAAYRIHGNSMSGNIHRMIHDVSKVLKRQKSNLRGDIEQEYFADGLYNWKKFYYDKYFSVVDDQIKKNKEGKIYRFKASAELSLLYLRFVYFKIKRHIKEFVP